MDEIDRHSIAGLPGPGQPEHASKAVEPSLKAGHSVPDGPPAFFLAQLSAGLANYTARGPSPARALAHALYPQAERDYTHKGAAVYGRTHAGLMRWIAEQLGVRDGEKAADEIILREN